MPIHLAPDQRRTFHDYLTGEKYAFASTLMAIVGYLYGAEFLSNPEDGLPWTPGSLRIQIAEDTGIDIDDKVMDKLMAAVLAVTDDRVFTDAVMFNNVATALYDRDMIVDEWDEPESEELAWAMVEILLLRGEDGPGAGINSEKPISDDVETYIRVVLEREGFTKPPRQLGFVELKNVKEDDYSDDPNVFAKIYKEQEARVAEIDKLVNTSVSATSTRIE